MYQKKLKKLKKMNERKIIFFKIMSPEEKIIKSFL